MSKIKAVCVLVFYIMAFTLYLAIRALCFGIANAYRHEKLYTVLLDLVLLLVIIGFWIDILYIARSQQ